MLSNHKKGLALAFVFGVGLLTQGAQAHFRDFCFSRDWYLPYRGEREIESRMKWIPRESLFDNEFEVEYGFSDHFAIEPGFALHREGSEDLHIDAWVCELRFNFGEFAYNRVLPALNIEYEHPLHDEPAHVEAKFCFSIFQKSGTDVTLNINVGTAWEHGANPEGEFTAGFCAPIGKNSLSEHGYNIGIRGGFELVSDFQEHHTGFGPVLVVRSGEHVNFVSTYLVGLTHSDENHDQFRIIGEYEF